jgi:hypothetical protein
MVISLVMVSHIVGAHKSSELESKLKARAFCMTLVNTTPNPFILRHCFKNASEFVDDGIVPAGGAIKKEVEIKDGSCDDGLRLLLKFCRPTQEVKSWGAWLKEQPQRFNPWALRDSPFDKNACLSLVTGLMYGRLDKHIVFITDEDKPRVEVYQGDDDFNIIVFSKFFSEVTVTPVYSQSMPLLKERTVPGLRCVPSTFSASRAMYTVLAGISIRYSVNGTFKEVFQTPIVPLSAQLGKVAICIESSISADKEKDSARKGIESKQERFPVATFYQWFE